MLRELVVHDLGVIERQALLLGPGLTALTGETGAGKTLIIEAVELLLGGRADPVLVRPGSLEASVEGRFDRVRPGPGCSPDPGGLTFDEIVLVRVVPAEGRARAYVEGRPASAATLAEIGADLVDLHGQHAHQSLLAPAEQRRALDTAAGIEHRRVDTARRVLAGLRTESERLGGDARSRARDLDLLRYQLEEIDIAGVDDPDEETGLRHEEEILAGAEALAAAAAAAYAALAGDDGALDCLGASLRLLGDGRPLGDLAGRLRGVLAEITDVAAEARARAETFEADPARLAEIGSRRHLLGDLRRKYGDTLAEVATYRDQARARLGELEANEARAALLDAELRAAEAELAGAEEEMGAARRSAAGSFAAAVETRLRTLAMPRARFWVQVGDDRAGEEVVWLLGANPGEAALPLVKVASGGELARTMLATRLALGAARASAEGGRDAARTLVFDEVDAGIGGEAAIAVGAALAALAARHQVLVVTHLPQVAAFADHHLVVTKTVEGERTVAKVKEVAGESRLEELARMLSGRPGSTTARQHAAELLDHAQRQSVSTSQMTEEDPGAG